MIPRSASKKHSLVGIRMSSALQATISGANTAERKALFDMYISEPIVNFFQKIRSALGFKPVGSPGIYIIGGIIFFIGIMLFSLAWKYASIIYTVIGNNPLIKVLLVLFILFLIFYGIYYFFFRPASKANYLDAAITDVKTFFEGFEGYEGFQTTPKVVDDTLSTIPLLNLQPMTLKQAGYIGPKERDGLFDLDAGLRSALKGGVRAFTLQIDYLDTKKDSGQFPPAGEPALLYRDDSRRLISTNGVDVKVAATMLANYAFAEESVGSKYPLIIYLHFVRTPDPIQKPETYLKFLSATAAALEPLAASQIGNTSEGTYTRQQNELGLLRLPLGNLARKVVFLTNVDTSLFRRTEQLGMKQFEPKRDLDVLTNIRVYAETSEDIAGATGMAPSPEKVHAILVSLKRILSLGEKERAAFRDMSKGRFIIALPTQLQNPTRKELELAYSLGVNLVPIHPFRDDKEEQSRILSLWGSEKLLKVRPPALQTAAMAVPVGATEQ